jgi:ADP-ribose pyrophosphatase YjhB (NUDIX family)
MPISPYLDGLRRAVGHELILVPSVTAIVFDLRGRLLLARHAEADVWVPPGGSIDPGERPADAVARETWEETGLLVRPLAIVGVYGGPEFEVTYGNGDRVGYVMTVFECGVVGGELRPDGEETRELRYFAETEIATLATPEWVGRVLPDVFHHGVDAQFASATWELPASP